MSSEKILFLIALLLNIGAAFLGNTLLSFKIAGVDCSFLATYIPLCLCGFVLDFGTNLIGGGFVRKVLVWSILLRICLVLLLMLTLYCNTEISASKIAYINMVIETLKSGTFATIVLFGINCYIFIWLAYVLNVKYIWGRYFIAICISEVLYSLLANFTLLIIEKSPQQIFSITIHTDLFVIVFELLSLPILLILFGCIERVNNYACDNIKYIGCKIDEFID